MQAPDFNPERLLTIKDLRFEPPTFALNEIKRLALELYGVQGEFSALAGERDQNHRIRCVDGRQFVFKISGQNEPADVVEMQVEALRYIEQHDSELPVPRVLPSLNGQMICQVQSPVGSHACRLMSWLPGVPYQEGPFPSATGLMNLGSFIARLGKALQGFDHSATRHFMPWNMTNGLVFSEQLKALLPASLGSWIQPFLERLQSTVYPQLRAQRWQVIHQDGHGANLLRAQDHNEALTGVIDFGDMIYGPLICDLVTCVSDFMEAAADPVNAAMQITLGYQRITPLHDEELDLLLDLAMVRQIMVLQLFEFMRRNQSQPQAFVTDDQPGVIALLQKLAKLDRQDFTQQLKEAVKHA
ncbi:MAG: phosphotransferase [Xanthomonadales bacterium]|nr:phosphotransferase [Xanthomonadales bacterium]